MRQLKKIERVRGSSVERLCWFDDFDATEITCVRRNIAPILITCEAIQSDLKCIYKNPQTRECMYRMSKEEYTTIPIKLIKALKDFRKRGFED